MIVGLLQPFLLRLGMHFLSPLLLGWFINDREGITALIGDPQVVLKITSIREFVNKKQRSGHFKHPRVSKKFHMSSFVFDPLSAAQDSRDNGRDGNGKEERHGMFVVILSLMLNISETKGL